jgi:hypothetical protein
MDGTYGYWVEDDDTAEVGFLPELEDVFWTYDDNADAWQSRHFKGRKMRRGAPKGKGKGKGSSGRKRFTPFRRKGKGKGGDAHATWDQQEADTWWSKGKKGKGKGKGTGKKGEGKDEGKGKTGGFGSGKGPKGSPAHAVEYTPMQVTSSSSSSANQQSSSPALAVNASWDDNSWWESSDWNEGFFVQDLAETTESVYHTHESTGGPHKRNPVDVRRNPDSCHTGSWMYPCHGITCRHQCVYGGSTETWPNL